MSIDTICYNCFRNKSLIRYIKKNAKYKECAVCHRKSIQNIAISFDVLVEKIKQSLRKEYIDPNDLLMSDDIDGWESCLGPYEMFIEDEADLQCTSSELQHAIANYFSSYQWFNESLYYYPYSNNLILSWDYYAKIIKEKWRYTFFLESPDRNEPSMLDYTTIFNEIIKLIDKSNLIVSLNKGTLIYRSREHTKTEKITKAESIGTPPCIKAQYPNRFSPAGISLFYGSFEKETARIEMQKTGKKKYYSIGEFKTNTEVKLIDLSNYLEIPGRYDDNNDFIEPIKFLNTFIKIISTPINKENYSEYAPTQVFVEYLRHVVALKYKIKGIIYRSAKADGKNVVLFYSSEECKDQINVNNEQDCLVLNSIENNKLS